MDETTSELDFISCWPPETITSPTEDEGNEPSQKHRLSHRKSHCKITVNKDNDLIDNRNQDINKKLGVQGKRSYADVAIARWWRHEGKALSAVEGLDLPRCFNPQTMISFIVKTELGQTFMKQEVNRLKKEGNCSLLSLGDTANRLAVLATFQEKLQDFMEAKASIEEAIDKTKQADDAKEYKWIRERIVRQVHMKEVQQRLGQTKAPPGEWPKYQQVERRSALHLTAEEFHSEYAVQSKPLIITNIVSSMTAIPWTLAHIHEVAGKCPVTLKKLDPHSTEWARLESSRQTTVGEFIGSLDQQEGMALTDKTYLFDWSLPVHCPRLSEELTIPKYFANDFLQRTTASSLYRDSWPSLFVAPSGVRSELHIDAFGSNFWMALFEGKKRWVFFDKEDTPCLYPTYSQSMDPVFEVDLSEPDFTKYPLLRHTSPRECVLQPGELLFVPAGCPHRVENLEKSLAISANFVDKSNYNLAVTELRVNGLMEERAEQLVGQLESAQFDRGMDFSMTNAHWAEFKRVT